MEWIRRRCRRENDLILFNDPDSVELIPFSFLRRRKAPGWACSYNAITTEFSARCRMSYLPLHVVATAPRLHLSVRESFSIFSSSFIVQEFPVWSIFFFFLFYWVCLCIPFSLIVANIIVEV